MLEFEVNGQRLRLKGNLYVVAESVDYLKARFAFSADWDGAAKTAIFKTADRKGVYNVILDENGICTVPSEVIHAPRFYVSVFGGSRITANEVEVQCNVSGYAEGSAPDTPTPEIYEQILAEINKKVSKVDGMGLSENSYTTEEKKKLGGIAEGAEVNVQSDWNQTNKDADDYIKNKPTSLPASDVYDWAKQPEKPTYTAAEVGAMPSDTEIPSYSVATQSADGLMSAADKKKLDGLSEGGGGGITEETDPTVPTWAKQPTKPTYTAAEVGADSAGSADSALTAAKKYTDAKVKTNVPENAVFTDTVYDDTEIKAALGSEETARKKADTTLQNNIINEVNARALADNELEESLNNHMGDTDNPHSVTKAQVGLGNVPNVATNDQTPTYTQASTLANLTSGEKLSVSLGKIMKAIADFITHKGSTSNPHSVTKSQVGLGNVPNVSTNSQTPTYGVASSLTALTSGETLSTAFGKIAKAVSEFISHKSNTSNPHSVTKSQVGLGNVDNTSDANKPISVAMQAALDKKLDKSGGTISSPLMSPLKVERTGTSGNFGSIEFLKNSTSYGHIGIAKVDDDVYHVLSDTSKQYPMLDSNNYKTIIGGTYFPQSTITTATDLNTLKTTGIYHIKIGTCTNVPTSNWGTLFVDFSTGTPYQIYISDGVSMDIYKRSYTNNTWSSWVHGSLADDTKAPTSHASTATTYGIGTSSNYGHVKLSNSTSTTSGASAGVAATPTAVKAAYDKANIKKNPDATDGDIISTHFTVGNRTSGSTVGENSVALGSNNTASNLRSIALGFYCQATGTNSAAIGFYNKASGTISLSTGYENNALDYQTKMGRYAASGTAGSQSGTTGDALTVGIGTSSGRKNAFRIDYSGSIYTYKGVNSTGADYAEMWEWQDGNPNAEDRVGYFVAFDGTKIRFANETDDLQKIGIISGNPAVIGDNFADDWQGMYLKDIYGRNITEHKSYEAEYDEDGNLIHEAYEADEYVLNPDYDATQPYIPRQQRKEWDAVGTHGKLVVKDDGTCQVDGFCRPTDGGIATASDNGFYVMERINDTHIRVYLK